MALALRNRLTTIRTPANAMMGTQGRSARQVPTHRSTPLVHLATDICCLLVADLVSD